MIFTKHIIAGWLNSDRHPMSKAEAWHGAKFRAELAMHRLKKHKNVIEC